MPFLLHGYKKLLWPHQWLKSLSVYQPLLLERSQRLNTYIKRQQGDFNIADAIKGFNVQTLHVGRGRLWLRRLAFCFPPFLSNLGAHFSILTTHKRLCFWSLRYVGDLWRGQKGRNKTVRWCARTRANQHIELLAKSGRDNGNKKGFWASSTTNESMQCFNSSCLFIRVSATHQEFWTSCDCGPLLISK